MTDKKTESRPEAAAPAPAPEHYAYTGGTAGHIVADGQVVADVKPGDVIAPRDAAHARQLKKTGLFEATSKRATKTPGPERFPQLEDVAGTPEADLAPADTTKETA